MTRNEMNIGLAAILTTLAETSEARIGILYAALMAGGRTLDDFLQLQMVLVSGGLVTVDGTLMTITAAGREMADKINAAAA